MSDSVRPLRPQPTRLPRPWDPPGKNTGVGCHFLLQYMKVKSESEVTQASSSMVYTVHGILQARILEWVAFPFSRGSSQPRDRTQVSLIAGRFFTSWATGEAQEHWSGQPMGCFSSRSSHPRNRTRVSCIVGRFFASWAMREAFLAQWLWANHTTSLSHDSI